MMVLRHIVLLGCKRVALQQKEQHKSWLVMTLPCSWLWGGFAIHHSYESTHSLYLYINLLVPLAFRLKIRLAMHPGFEIEWWCDGPLEGGPFEGFDWEAKPKGVLILGVTVSFDGIEALLEQQAIYSLSIMASK